MHVPALVLVVPLFLRGGDHLAAGAGVPAGGGAGAVMYDIRQSRPSKRQATALLALGGRAQAGGEVTSALGCIQNTTGQGQELSAGVGKLYAARRPDEQLQSQVAFELLHVPGHRGLDKAQLARRAGVAPALDHRHKGLELAQFGQGCLRCLTLLHSPRTRPDASCAYVVGEEVVAQQRLTVGRREPRLPQRRTSRRRAVSGGLWQGRRSSSLCRRDGAPSSSSPTC